MKKRKLKIVIIVLIALLSFATMFLTCEFMNSLIPRTTNSNSNTTATAATTTVSKNMFDEIKKNFYELEPTYFLDYSSTLDYSGLSIFESLALFDMKEFNIALDPLYRGAPKEAIKRLTELLYRLNPDIIKQIFDLDNILVNSIKNIEQTLIYKYDYNRKNHIYFGRLNKRTPISFEIIDKVGDDYLLLQDSVFDLELESDEIYEDGICQLRNNEVIKKCFEIEDDLIKDIYIFSEKDYDRYKKRYKKTVGKYLDVNGQNDDTIIENCEKALQYHEYSRQYIYWVKDDNDWKAIKAYDGTKGTIVNVSDNIKAGVRLAILVKGFGDINEK